jgi:site-specific DNA recombinase
MTFGGAEGIRTPDLLRAKEALSQLSYSPICLDYIS